MTLPTKILTNLGSLRGLAASMIRARMPLLLSSFLMVPSFLWIVLDETVWPWDPAWYGEVATDLWWTLLHATATWTEQMLTAFGSKAPGVAWVGQLFVPLGQAAGSVEFGLLLSILVAAWATLLLLAPIGTAIWGGDHRGGLLAILLAGTAPMFVGMSHQFMVEIMQTLAVTYVYWLATNGGSRTRMTLVGHALLAGALGMAAKVTTPLYCGLPALVVLARLWTAPSTQAPAGIPLQRWKERAFVLVGLLSLAAAMAWYGRNSETLREFVRLATQSEVALQYGHKPEFRAKWIFWFRAFTGSLLLPWSGAALLALGAWVALVAYFRPAGRIAPGRWTTATAVAAGLTITITLFTFTRQINEETRYLLPLMPSLAVVVLAGLSLAGRTATTRLIALVLATQAVLVHGTALRFWPRPSAATVWLLPYETDKTRKRDVMRVIRATTVPGTAGRYHVNTYETPWLNANSLAFYAAKHRLHAGFRGYYTSLGYAATDLDVAWARVEAMQAASLIGMDPTRQDKPPNFLNQLALPALQRAHADPHYMPRELANRSGIMLYVRVP